MTRKHVDRRRWLAPTDAQLRALLSLPELALVAESGDAERHLHARLEDAPRAAVAPGELDALADADVRSNYAMFLAFRDALLAAGTFEAYYLALVRGGPVAVAPVLVDRLVEAIVLHVLGDVEDPFQRRAGQMLYRQQRITVSGGRALAADRETVDRLSDTASGADLAVLTPANAPADALGDDADALRALVLDLGHEVANDLGHGLTFTMTRSSSGLSALARVLERWIGHFFGVEAAIRPLRRIDDPAWAWHIGLDVESTSLLNDLYRGDAVDGARLQRLLGLFRLDFADAGDMRADLAGKPVYLGLAMSSEQMLKVKAQNLLVSLPLR